MTRLINVALVCIMLTMGSIGTMAQAKKKTTTTRRTTVAKPAEQQQTKERIVGEDGFVWFKTQKGSLYGAVDTEGKTIVPTEYDNVKYEVSMGVGTRFFYVTKRVNDKEYKAAYSPKGTCIIPTERGYTFIRESATNHKYIYFNVGNGEGGYGLCDAQGQEVIAPSNEFGFPGPKLHERYGTLYIEATPPASKRKMPFNNGYGLYDANGSCIIPMDQVGRSWPNQWNTAIVVVPYPGGVKNRYEKPIRLTTEYIYDYFIYDELYFLPKQQDEDSSPTNNPPTTDQNKQKQSTQKSNYVPDSSTELLNNSTVSEYDSGGNSSNSSSSTHQSSSSTSKMCGQCYGNGRCNSCSGKGWHYGSYGNGDKRVNCSSCSGTGTCRWCGGTGRR